MICLASKVVMHSTCIDRVQSLPWPTAVMISKQIFSQNMFTNLSEAGRCLVHAHVAGCTLPGWRTNALWCQHSPAVGWGKEKEWGTTSPQTKHNSSKCSKTLLIWYQFTSKINIFVHYFKFTNWATCLTQTSTRSLPFFDTTILYWL